MVGFYSPLADSVSEEAEGIDAIPSTANQVVGDTIRSGFQESYGPRVARFIDSHADEAEPYQADMVGLPAPDPAEVPTPTPKLDPAAANAKYGIPGGVLDFKEPVSDAVAASLYQAKHDEIVRQNTIDRRAGGMLTSGVARTAFGFLGGLMDPVNLAASLIPGVGEARVAGALGESALGRLGTRAIVGASQGLAGQAALEPLNYALDQTEHTDWTFSQALRDLAFGAALGGGLHVAGGTLADLMGRTRQARQAGGEFDTGAVPAEVTPAALLGERLEAAGPEARETLLQSSMGQMLDDRPVTAAPALDAMEAWQRPEVPSGPNEWQTHLGGLQERHEAATADLEAFQAARDARNRGEAPELLQDYQTPAGVDAAIRAKSATVDALSGRMALAERAVSDLAENRPPPFAVRYPEPEMNRQVSTESVRGAPQTLLGRVREMGGLRDDGGELSARDLHKTPGMVRASGQHVDAAALNLADEGFLPDVARDRAGGGPDQVSAKDSLLEAIDQERAGLPRYREADALDHADAIDRHQVAMDRLSTVADHLGLTPREARGLTRGQVADILADRDSMMSGEYGARGPEHLDRAVSDLRAAARAPDPEAVATERAADAAVKAPPSTLDTLRQEVADMEAQQRPALDEAGQFVATAGHPEVAAANQLVEDAETRARAREQAAACLLRAGA